MHTNQMTEVQKLRRQKARNDKPVNYFREDIESAIHNRETEE